ncbi:hypothetical protein EW145_g4011 [Phellinidium pouzarii]|uniref:Gti1/Pac2 family-domain-containing protein n=1 Tax=Phellinidium pouzarii TaxID=167371 RepID=A0A4S4L514_9AGAM|nr:hypothetical protein EW145_g4011 [Phellinidium pouzarii]
MQPPTCTGVRIRSVHDAHVVFHAVYLKILPMVARRLDAEERRAVRAGNVYVWEERGRNSEATGLGIERWTDGIRWSASRVRDEFLLYHERESGTDYEITDSELGASYRLVKQTYSVFVDTPNGRRKWHITAYFVPGTVTQLRTIDELPTIANIRPPEGMYTSAKMGKGRARGGDYYPADIHSGPVALPEMSMSGQQYRPPPTFAPYPGPSLPPPGGLDMQAPCTPPWPAQSSPLSPRGREGQILPNPARLLPPPVLGIHPAPPVQSPYSPRHPLDDEALRSLGRGI